ncbi:MAG TPA: EF-hand domain-containing protein [Gammaproteobacteria bacterium]|nr:EF-hand domain-containing protein [Gammaproteobacteria bacterium]
MRISRWIFAVTLCLFAGAALAAQQPDSDSAKLPDFKKADKNGDGHLTYSEVKDLGVKKKKFKQEDLNDDGKLSKYDYKYGIK